MRDLIDLHFALQAANLDIQGVCDPGPKARITGWNVPPTQADLVKADAILKSFDWSDQPAPDVAAKVAKLTPQQKQKLLDLAVLQAVQQNPALLEQV
jgi:hypothetical protein